MFDPGDLSQESGADLMTQMLEGKQGAPVLLDVLATVLTPVRDTCCLGEASRSANQQTAATEVKKEAPPTGEAFGEQAEQKARPAEGLA